MNETVENAQYQTQKDLEELFSKHQLMDTLRAEFAEISDDKFAIEAMVQIYLHKSADVPTMVGLFTPAWGTPQEVADMLLQCAEDDFLQYDQSTERFSLLYAVSEDVEAMLERYQYPLPMIIPPRTIHENAGSMSTTGYLTINQRLVLNGSSVFNGMDICLDHLNRANSVGLKLDLDVIASPEGKMLMPSRKDGELFKDYLKRKRQANVFYSTSEEVMRGLMAMGNTLWLTHKYDRRGRTYASGYHVNTQGTDYNKAVLELANQEVVEG